MKGNEKVIETLNNLLADELTAINQYILHAEMCSNWGYEKLHNKVQERAVQEMKHAEKLIERVLFLEGKPIITKLNPIMIGDNVKKQFENDLVAESGAIKAYNAAIKFTSDSGDNGTKSLLESILKDEENHLDWIETQIDMVEKVGFENYLLSQVA